MSPSSKIPQIQKSITAVRSSRSHVQKTAAAGGYRNVGEVKKQVRATAISAAKKRPDQATGYAHIRTRITGRRAITGIAISECVRCRWK